MSAPRTTLRWRLSLVYGAVAAGIGLILLLLSMLLTGRALSAGRVNAPPRLGVQLPDGQVLTLAEFQAQLREQALSSLFRQGLIALVLVSLLGVLVAYLVAGQVLRPLQQITSAAQRLSAEQLGERIALVGPDDELKELADTFDAMLARLQAAFEAQRRFVADASHELRTPLAVMRTEVDVALANPRTTAAELRAAAAVVRDATERADRLVDSLLLLARGQALPDGGGLPSQEPVALPEAAAVALSSVAAEIESNALTVDTSYGAAVVLGDRVLLERLAGNLVENAVRHNVQGGWVRVDTGTLPGAARLQVSNSGPVLAPEEVAGLFEPFRRYGTARTARRGAGLGLSIVRAVATAHGGTATAEARAGGGLVVTVDLPPAAERAAI
ncbi:MAG TPA: HAMP domain-containing sensor histidine kinase [Mycobacteriales bacterium]|nr:HAMP domain-containing sensor histidine kinase [Mycobacteriales bacterium]